MLSSDVRKLMNFAKQAEELSGESLIEFCIANDDDHPRPSKDARSATPKSALAMTVDPNSRRTGGARNVSKGR